MDVFLLFLMMFLLVLAFAALPVWPYARERDWGYYLSGAALTLFLLLLLLVYFGLIAVWWPWAAVEPVAVAPAD